MSINKIKKIIPLKNKDKQDHEKWYPGRDLLNIPSPFCCIIIGPRNSGKTNLIKNIIVHASPLFNSGYLVHYDALGTEEYEETGIDILEPGYIPSNDEIPKEGKKIIIFEDIPYDSLTKEDKIKLCGLLKYSISHKNTTIIWTGHDFITSVPTNIRRLFNVFVIYKIPDMSILKNIGLKCGLNNDDFVNLFNEFVKDRHDCICIDLTKDSPAPIRFNMFHKIEIDE